jgi:hypothetical protein
MVDKDLGNLSFLSINVAIGKNSMAIKNARKKGDKILCPKARRYPIPMIETITRVSFRRKGILKKFIL